MVVVPLLTSIVLLYLLMVVLFYVFQEHLLFRPRLLKETYEFHFNAFFEELFISMPDGGRINALHFRAPLPKGIVIYFHGNADNLKRWGKYYPDFVDRGYDFFVYDYRGFGKSTGSFKADTFYEDALRIYELVLKMYPPEQIVLYGRSLGTGIASTLATQVQARSVILETPYDTLYHAIRVRFPLLWLPLPLRYHFQNIDNMQLIKCPIFIFHGTKDELIRLRSARKLKSLVRNNGKFYIIQGGYHKNLPEFMAYQEAMDEILEE